MRSTGINATSNSATGTTTTRPANTISKRSNERRHDECEPVHEPAVQEESRLADRVERVAVLEHRDPRCECLHEIERDEPRHRNQERGIPSATPPSGPSACSAITHGAASSARLPMKAAT